MSHGEKPYHPDQTDDFLGLLTREFYKTRITESCPSGVLRCTMIDVEDFTSWCREWLRKNYVVAFYPAVNGLGLLLREGQRAPLAPQPPDRPSADESIHITDPGPDNVPADPRERMYVPITGARP